MGSLASKLRSLGVGSQTGGPGGRGTGHDFTHTRPDSLETKTGTSGRPIALKANFVQVSLPLPLSSSLGGDET